MSPLTSQPEHGTRNGLVMTVTLLILLIALALLLGGVRPAHAQEVKPVPFAFADFTVRSRSPRLHGRRRCHRQPRKQENRVTLALLVKR